MLWKACLQILLEISIHLDAFQVHTIFSPKIFSCVIPRLYTKFQCLTMPGTGQKVCSGGGGGWVVFKAITRLSYYNVTTRLADLVGLCWLK